jgi:deoxyribodipyrimidine photolyase
MKFKLWLLENAAAPQELPNEIQEFIYNLAPYGHAVQMSFPAAAKRAPGEFIMSGQQFLQLLQQFFNRASQALRNPASPVEYRKQLGEYLQKNQQILNHYFTDPEFANQTYVIHTNRPGQRYAENKLNTVFPVL